MSTLRSKILTSYGLSTGALLIFIAIVIADLNYLKTHIVEGEVVNELYSASQKIRREEKNLFLYHNRNDLQQLQQQLNIASNALTEERSLFATLIGEDNVQELEQVLNLYNQQLEEYTRLPMDVRTSKQEEIRTTGHRLTELTQDLNQTQRSILARTTSVAAITLMVAAAIVVLIGLVSALFTGRRVVRPLVQLENQLDELADGQLQTLSQPSNDTEIKSFVFHFNSMLEQLREQQIQLRRHERAAALGVLVSGVAHELNNPLSNISTSVQLLMEEDENTREDLRKQWLTHIDGETERARRIVRRLLDAVRQPTQHMQPMAADKLVQGAVLLIHRLLPADKYLHIEDIADNELFVDRERMQQVFINLIKNATHAGASNIWITGKATSWEKSKPVNSNNLAGDTIGISQFQQVMLIHVDDDGPGIPAEHLPQLFDPFFTTQTGGEGTGLGLYLVEEIINEHSGCIAVENRDEGGARFTIWLPLKQASTTEQE